MRAFVIRPFGKKPISPEVTIDFELIHEKLIAPALEAAGLAGGTTGEIIDAGNIREDMFALIIEADLVVADVTVHNANVFYELGIRHALRKRCSVMIKGKPVKDSTPFDLLTDRYVPYCIADPGKAFAELTATLLATMASERETDSPIFKMLPRLQEADPDTIQVVPTDFTEELGRARAAKSRGWLRLLADDVRGRRFEWPALRLVAQAQFEVKDYEGAGRTWERVRATAPKDIRANLALANIYERQYKELNKPEVLETSNHAVARVLEETRLTPRQQSEALGLRGRNLKTLWRRDFDRQDDIAPRRQAAVNSMLLEAYEAYRSAYLFDLNGYWPGLAALQQGVIALNLASESAWDDTFDEPQKRREELASQVASLRPIVVQAVETAIARAASADDRLWAKISAADLRFLSEDRPARVIQAYRDAIPRDNPFAWDAAKTQLQLFVSLGVKAELANEVIQKIEPLVTVPTPPADLLLVIFAGHQIDEPQREKPRFPSDREERARTLIRQQLQSVIQAGTPATVLASAAPGADIICHELCQSLGIDSMLCLPMPKDDYARSVFGELDTWRTRFLALTASSRPVLQLSDQPRLPRWLEGSGLDPWERGNRWVLQMARTSGATKVMLIALWDKSPTGDRPGGTAHMVKLARDAGDVDVLIIDAKELLD
jgi:hypothetical protein